MPKKVRKNISSHAKINSGKVSAIYLYLTIKYMTFIKKKFVLRETLFQLKHARGKLKTMKMSMKIKF